MCRSKRCCERANDTRMCCQTVSEQHSWLLMALAWAKGDSLVAQCWRTYEEAGQSTYGSAAAQTSSKFLGAKVYRHVMMLSSTLESDNNHLLVLYTV
jgi:hypothetical protein